MTLDASPRPTPSPIVRILNEEVRHYYRWCTPSTLVGQERIEDFYASDVSISAGFFGTLVDHTGVFGEAERFAAAAQGADRTMFSVHGSSGSNWMSEHAMVIVDEAWGGHAGNPFSAIDARPVIHAYAARRYAKSIGHEVPLREAVGKVAAEHVEVYPPGIP